jgi:hypothetical protein
MTKAASPSSGLWSAGELAARVTQSHSACGHTGGELSYEMHDRMKKANVGCNMLAMHFLYLYCHSTSTGAGEDEVYLTINGHRATEPRTMVENTRIDLNLFNSGLPPGVPETRFSITLMEEDTFDDDNLGTVSFTVNDFDWFDDFWNKIRKAKFTGGGADYTLVYKFADIP